MMTRSKRSVRAILRHRAGLHPAADRFLHGAGESGDTLAYTVKKAELGKEVWPIGWPPENTQKVLPGIYEFHNVNVASVAATKVLGAIGNSSKYTCSTTTTPWRGTASILRRR